MTTSSGSSLADRSPRSGGSRRGADTAAIEDQHPVHEVETLGAVRDEQDRRSPAAANTSSTSASAPSGSRWAVGSSSTRTGAPARSARATTRRRCCPPESSRPSSPTRVSRPSGRRATQGQRPTSGAPPRARRRSQPAAPGARSPDAGGEQVVVLARHGDRARTSSWRRWRRSIPPSVTRPSAGSRKRRRRLAIVLFPAPLAPTSATRLTRVEPERDAGEHVRRCRRVAGVHVLESQRERRERGRRRAGGSTTAGSRSSSRSRGSRRRGGRDLPRRGRERLHRLERPQGQQGEERDQDPVERAVRVGGEGHREHAATVAPATRVIRPSPHPSASARRWDRRTSRASCTRSARAARPSARERELRGAAHHSTSSPVRAPRASASCAPARGRAPRGPGTASRPRSAGREHEAGRRQEHGGRGHGDRPRDDGHRRAARARRWRFCSASTSATAVESSSPSRERLEARRGERLHARVDARAHAREDAEGQVVRGQALGIPQDRGAPGRRSARPRWPRSGRGWPAAPPHARSDSRTWPAAPCRRAPSPHPGRRPGPRRPGRPGQGGAGGGWRSRRGLALGRDTARPPASTTTRSASAPAPAGGR